VPIFIRWYSKSVWISGNRINSPPIINISLPFATCVHNYVYSYHKFVSGDYTLLYNILSACVWSCAYGTTSVDAAVASLNAVLAWNRQFPVALLTLDQNSHIGILVP
jgi:hypothetical protein